MARPCGVVKIHTFKRVQEPSPHVEYIITYEQQDESGHSTPRGGMNATFSTQVSYRAITPSHDTPHYHTPMCALPPAAVAARSTASLTFSCCTSS